MIPDAASAAPSLVARARPHASELGVNPLGWFFIGVQAVALAADVLVFSATGLSINWATAAIAALQTLVLLGIWLNFYFAPGKPREWFLAEVVFVIFLMVLLTNLMSPMQYGAIALQFPFIDSWLASADAALGVHVPTLVGWTTEHPIVAQFLALTYFSLLPQLFFAVIALAVLRERELLWELAFHFHLCLVVTVGALVVWPAICAPAYYHFRPTIDITREI